jgi:hypothetical protein
VTLNVLGELIEEYEQSTESSFIKLLINRTIDFNDLIIYQWVKRTACRQFWIKLCKSYERLVVIILKRCLKRIDIPDLRIKLLISGRIILFPDVNRLKSF